MLYKNNGFFVMKRNCLYEAFDGYYNIS